jgi:hypothetical protein
MGRCNGALWLMPDAPQKVKIETLEKNECQPNRARGGGRVKTYTPPSLDDR